MIRAIRHGLLIGVEAILDGPLVGRAALWAWGALALGMALAACLLMLSGSGVPADIFYLLVVLATICFRERGMWLSLPCVVLYHFASYSAQSETHLSQLAHDGLELLQWTLVGGLILTGLKRFSASRAHEARINRDVSMARTLQMALVPRNYDYGRVRIHGIIRQCQDIGGDFYYFRPFQNKYVVFCLGDVMGKGIPSSMIMAIIMGFFSEWGKRSASPSQVMSRLNERLLRLWREETTWFTTLFYGVFDEETGTLRFSAGGGQEALLLRVNGEVTHLHCEGLPVGAFHDVEWEERELDMAEGDRIMLYTDGVTEARSAIDGELYGSERLKSFVRANAQLSSHKLSAAIEAEIMAYTGGVHSDDLALLIMEVKIGCIWSPQKKAE